VFLIRDSHIPVIGADTGGIPELLVEEDLVAVEDVENLAAKMIKCMRRSKRLEQISSCNFEKAEKFRLEQVQLLRKM